MKMDDVWLGVLADLAKYPYAEAGLVFNGNSCDSSFEMIHCVFSNEKANQVSTK